MNLRRQRFSCWLIFCLHLGLAPVCVKPEEQKGLSSVELRVGAKQCSLGNLQATDPVVTVTEAMFSVAFCAVNCSSELMFVHSGISGIIS